MDNRITPNEVAAELGNNEAKILGLAAGYFGIKHQNSWYIAASEIARELNNVAAQPLATLQHILSQIH